MPRALSTLLDESERLLLLVLSVPRSASTLAEELEAAVLKVCCPVISPLMFPRAPSTLEEERERLFDEVWFAAKAVSKPAEATERFTEEV